jgi:hypothetical protein
LRACTAPSGAGVSVARRRDAEPRFFNLPAGWWQDGLEGNRIRRTIAIAAVKKDGQESAQMTPTWGFSLENITGG